MKLIHSTKFQVVLYLTVFVAVFGVAYSMLGQGQGGRTPAEPEPTDGDKLARALAFDDNEPLQELLDAGADPNSLTTDGYLPLQLAVYAAENSETVYGKIQLLLRSGANPNQANSKGLTPMDAAGMAGTEAIMKAFLDAGGNPHLSADGSLTPYESAMAFGKDGPLSAIKQAVPDHVPADKKRHKGFESARIINRGLDKAFLLTGEDQNAQIRKIVDELVRNGNVPAGEADSLYKQFQEEMRKHNEREREVRGQ